MDDAQPGDDERGIDGRVLCGAEGVGSLRNRDRETPTETAHWRNLDWAR